MVKKYFSAQSPMSTNAVLGAFHQQQTMLEQLGAVLISLRSNPDELLYLSTSASELYGESWAMLARHPSFWREAIHPEDAAEVWQTFSQLKQVGQRCDLHYRILRSDGEQPQVWQQCVVVRDAQHMGLRIDCLIRIQPRPQPANSRLDFGAAFLVCGEAMLVRDARTLLIVDANPAALALLQLSRASVLRQALSAFSDTAAGFSASKEQALLGCLQRGETARYDWQLRAADGQLLQIAAVSSPISLLERPCILTLLHDLSAREQQAGAQARAQAVWEHSRDMHLSFDRSSLLISSNGSGFKRLELTQDAIGKLCIADLFPPWAQPHVLHSAVPQASRTGAWHGEAVLQGSQGRQLPVMLSLLAHRQDEQLQGFSLVAQDIAPYKLNQISLQQENEGLQASLLLHQKLLENIGAGLRQPLQQMQATLQALQADPSLCAASLPSLLQSLKGANRLLQEAEQFRQSENSDLSPK